MIIREFAFSFARHVGVELTPDQMRAVKTDICSQFGGERFYVPSEPKARTQSRVAAQLKAGRKTQSELARSTGLSERSVRRAINGK